MSQNSSNIRQQLFSVVIPVFNSERVVATTTERTVSFFRDKGYSFEIVLVNDGSSDGSWTVLKQLSGKYPEVKAVNLLHNYGQHNANLCGFRESSGDYVITMDDDMQNPPEEIEKLIEAAADGSDLVIGEFKEKKHNLVRRLGSKLVGKINRKVFFGQKDLVLSNFRLIKRDVVDRVCDYESRAPYIPGLVLMCSSNRKNTLVEHRAREVGKSNYNPYRVLKMVSTILFNYSSLPLRYMAGFGFIVSIFSFVLALYYFLAALFAGVSVPGWSTLVILLSFFNGVLIMLISVVGEYVVRLLRESGSAKSYYIKEKVE